MSYTITNYATKAALKRDLAAGAIIELASNPMGGDVQNGRAYLEGPHYPKPHSWYAQATIVNGRVTKVS